MQDNRGNKNLGALLDNFSDMRYNTKISDAPRNEDELLAKHGHFKPDVRSMTPTERSSTDRTFRKILEECKQKERSEWYKSTDGVNVYAIKNPLTAPINPETGAMIRIAPKFLGSLHQSKPKKDNFGTPYDNSDEQL